MFSIQAMAGVPIRKLDKMDWLFPSFRLDAFRLTGMDKPVLLKKFKQNKLELKNASISVGSHPLF